MGLEPARITLEPVSVERDDSGAVVWLLFEPTPGTTIRISRLGEVDYEGPNAMSLFMRYNKILRRSWEKWKKGD